MFTLLVKTIDGIINFGSCLLTKSSSNDELNNAQEPKSDNPSSTLDKESSTPDQAPEPGKDGEPKGEDEKGKDSRIRDVTAESSKMRTRSDRSSSKSDTTKVRSKRTPTRAREIQRNLRVLTRELDKYLDGNGKYNGIVRLMNAEFLKYAYSLIKSNPGNMTKGSSPETLDRISNAFFDKTAKDILEGRFKFEPARMIEVPKPNKPGAFRKLQVANPRHKIVQKALQLILQAI